MEKLLELLTELLNRMIEEQNDDMTQKWIKLATLKYSLRTSFLHFENSLKCYVPGEDKERIMSDFHKLKDLLWQAVGSVHGNLANRPVDVEVRCYTQPFPVYFEYYATCVCTMANLNCCDITF